jgi:hypothetical protein
VLQRLLVLQIPPESTSVFPRIGQGMAIMMARIFAKILGKLSEIGYSLPAYYMGYFDSIKVHNASSF